MIPIRAALIGALAALALPPAVIAQPVEVNIMTGGPQGTYYRFGQDIADLGANCGLAIGVQQSAGSVENVFAVRDRPVTQFGIVQSDVLEYFQTYQNEDPALRRAAQGLRIAFPLYDEEIHILARRDIGDLAGLAGQRVAAGTDGSGTALTSRLVLDLAEISPGETRADLGNAEALDALIAGEIDAMFYVVGAPAALFDDPRIDPERFHLLPVSDPVLAQVYSPATIAAGTYPFLTEDVTGIAVKAVLMAFDYNRAGNAYHRASCAAVADVSHLILTRFDTLRDSGHPKWQSVEMTAIPPGWEVSDCVLEGLSPTHDFTCTGPDGAVAETPEIALPEGNRLYIERVCARIGC